MKKTIILLLMIMTTAILSNAQNKFVTKKFKTEGRENLYLGKADTVVAEGDINKDGNKDVVIAEQNGGELAVYFGSADGYKLYNIYPTNGEKCEYEHRKSQEFYVNVSITAKGVLRIATSEMIFGQTCEDPDTYDCAYSDNISLVYMLRYQDNDLYLIGGNKSIYREGDGSLAVSGGGSYNTLTNKKIPIDIDGSTLLRDQITDIPKKPLKSLSEITIGLYDFEDYD